MDRRQKRTRQAVYDAFTSLLEEKTYSNITVQDIIDRANIGRSTFYSHFETRDDLLKSLCKEIFDHVFSENIAREQTHDFSKSDKDIRDEITHILYHLNDSHRYIRRIFLSESGDIFMQYFKKYLRNVFSGAIKDTPSDVPRDYILNHLVCDFAETVRWWMNNPEYSPEQISSFFFDTRPFAK